MEQGAEIDKGARGISLQVIQKNGVQNRGVTVGFTTEVRLLVEAVKCLVSLQVFSGAFEQVVT